MKELSTEQIASLLRAHRLKVTKGRVAVYGLLNAYGHASADMILEQLKNDCPTLTVATVYNILESFVDAGLVKKRLSQGAKMLFDVNTYQHVHLYDSAHNMLRDYDSPELMQLVTDFMAERKIKGFNIEDIDIQLIGKFEK